MIANPNTTNKYTLEGTLVSAPQLSHKYKNSKRVHKSGNHRFRHEIHQITKLPQQPANNLNDAKEMKLPADGFSPCSWRSHHHQRHCPAAPGYHPDGYPLKRWQHRYRMKRIKPKFRVDACDNGKCDSFRINASATTIPDNESPLIFLITSVF